MADLDRLGRDDLHRSELEVDQGFSLDKPPNQLNQEVRGR